MKYAVIIDHCADRAAIKAVFPAHRGYLRSLLDDGTLAAAGPRTDDAGALWVLEAESPEQADALVRADPAFAAGVFAAWRLYPLVYWSARDAKAS